MSIQQTSFEQELLQLLTRYNCRLEKYQNNTLPEIGFSSNFKSLRIKGNPINLDLFDFIEKIKVFQG